MNLNIRNCYVTVAAFSGLAFLLLTILVKTDQTTALDLTLRNWALSINSPASVVVWKAFTFVGSVALLASLTVAALYILAWSKRWSDLRPILALAVGDIILDVGSKMTVHRPRPTKVYANTMPTSFSYPSGHAFYSLLFYLSAIFLVDRVSNKPMSPTSWALAILLVIAIGAARIFLGVHYASDVLAGYLLAISWLCGVRGLHASDLQRAK